MAIALSRSEYRELQCFGLPGVYPKSTEQAVGELRARGYDANAHVLTYMSRKGQVRPRRTARNFEWHADHIDQAAAILEEHGLYTPVATMCLALGISYGQYLRALRKAAEEVNREYGCAAVGEKPDLFVMHNYPPRLNEDGHVWFTLAEDVRSQLDAKHGRPAVELEVCAG